MSRSLVLHTYACAHMTTHTDTHTHMDGGTDGLRGSNSRITFPVTNHTPRSDLRFFLVTPEVSESSPPSQKMSSVRPCVPTVAVPTVAHESGGLHATWTEQRSPLGTTVKVFSVTHFAPSRRSCSGPPDSRVLPRPSPHTGWQSHRTRPTPPPRYS